MSRTIASVLAAAMLVLAGCGASVAPGSPTAALEGTSAGAGTDASTGTGTVTFYISDQPNAINDFEHLNVTITKVGFKKVDADDAEDPVENESDAESENGTETDPEDDEETDEADGEDDAESEDERDEERGEENRTEDEDEDGEWVTYDVENRTVDLTELQGENASRLSAFELPNGTYTKVFVHVSEVEGTLKDGTQVNVKLPSQKLQLNKRFTVGNGEAVDFVFDITVFKAGNSGKYILKPVVSESGVDQPIREVDEDDEDEDEADEPEDASDLQARFLGSVAPGENATIQVTRQGEPVANATVTVDGERIGATDADGRITVTVPSDAEELEIEITAGEAEVSLEREFETDDERTESDDENAGDNGDG